MKVAVYLIVGSALLLILALQFLYFGPELPDSMQADRVQQPRNAATVQPCSVGDRRQLIADDYAIYRSLLTPLISEWEENLTSFRQATGKPAPGAVILIMQTIPARNYLDQPIDLNLPEGTVMDESLFFDFERVRDFETLLDAEKLNELAIVPTTREEVKRIRDSTDYSYSSLEEIPLFGFSEIINFSRIGYSCRGNEALVHMTRSDGGWLFVMTRKKGVWQPSYEKQLWVTVNLQ